MAGTKAGGMAAAATNKKRYGEDFYVKIGSAGGKLGKTGGFAAGEAGRERARVYGAIGGAISRRDTPLSSEEATRVRIQAGMVPAGMKEIVSVIPPHKSFFVFWKKRNGNK